MRQEKIFHEGYELLLGSNSTEQYYRHLGARFIAQFIAATPANTPAAFAVCSSFETELIGEQDLYDRFPRAKELHAQKLEKNEPAAKRLRQERTSLKQEKDTLSNELEVIKIKSGSTEKQQGESVSRQLEIRERTAEIDLRLKQTLLELRRLKPKYKPVYSLRKKEGESEKALRAKKEDWEILREWHQERSAKLSEIQPANPLPQNLSLLAKELGLNKAQEEVLSLILAYEKSGDFHGFVEYFSGKREDGYHQVIARIMGIEADQVSEMLHSRGNLVGYGLIELNKENEMPGISRSLKRKLSEQGTTIQTVMDDLMGKVIPPKLDWHKNFDGHGKDGDFLVLCLAANLTEGKGSSVSFTGGPGLGKTTSAAALVKELSAITGRNLELRLVGERAEVAKAKHKSKKGFESDDSENEKSKVEELDAQSRLSQILIARALARNNPNVVFLVEEPDSLFPKAGAKADPIDRVAIQRLLEDKGHGIMILTGNNWNFHEAVEQRIDHQLAFHELNALERASILSSLCELNGVIVSEQERMRLATHYNLPPRLIEQAVECTALMARNSKGLNQTEALEHWMQKRAQSIFGSLQAVFDGNPNTANGHFDTTFFNITTNIPNTDATQLMEKLVAADNHHRDFMLLCEGHEGTGRRSFAWHLASQMGLEILPLNLSHLFGSPPMEIEAILEGSLQIAHNTNKLIFIEYNPERLGFFQADQMQEIVHHMRQPRLVSSPVIISSSPNAGLAEDFGTQFAHVLKFDFLTPEQTYAAFAHFYNVPATQGSLDGLNRLAVGDFQSLLKSATRLGTIDNPQALVENLVAINADKPREQKPLNNKTQTAIGFGAQLEAMRKVAVGTAKDAGQENPSVHS